MADPKPITVEYVAPENYDGAYEPQPYTIVGEDPSGEGGEITEFTQVGGSATDPIILPGTDLQQIVDNISLAIQMNSGQISEKADATHTHGAGDVTSGTFAAARIPSLETSKITGLQAIIDDFEARIAALESTAGA